MVLFNRPKIGQDTTTKLKDPKLTKLCPQITIFWWSDGHLGFFSFLGWAPWILPFFRSFFQKWCRYVSCHQARVWWACSENVTLYSLLLLKILQILNHRKITTEWNLNFSLGTHPLNEDEPLSQFKRKSERWQQHFQLNWAGMTLFLEYHIH